MILFDARKLQEWNDAKQRAHEKKWANWRPKFLWVPRKLIDGRYAWLETVEAMYYLSPNRGSGYYSVGLFSSTYYLRRIEK